MSVNETKWVRLGDYIEQCTAINSDLQFGIDDVRGMTISKEIIPTKADLKSTDLSKFLVVGPKEFVYNPRTHGKKIGLGFNTTDSNFIISWNNVAFRVKDPNLLCPDFLYILISREEWDRNACFRSWGSSTEVFSWAEFGSMEIPLPSIDVQRELVDTYNGLKSLAEQNEALIPRLSAACQAYIVDCRAKYPSVSLREYIEQSDERNGKGNYLLEDVIGISNEKSLIPTKADMKDVSLTPYKLFRPTDFCYVTVTSRNGGKISLTLNTTDQMKIVSSSYIVFRIKDSDKLLPEFLFLLFNRPEFDRYTRFNSWGSAREMFDWNEMCRVQIPLPPIDVQQAIVDVYHCMERAKQIATTAREKLKTLCPALVQRAAHS